ncbi:protein kinase [Actinoplanes sp. NPDC049668]|uniref:protein kinase domain-containing protein n=1 Tax=unclassified Actinoplanes TaxID=2626549 RepID=UPI0033A6C83C
MGWLATGRRGGLVGNRYRLIERLGTGGMSVVWRAHDEVLGRAVAVKVLSPQLATDSLFRDRLRQEALAAARLCHPHITGIFDFGESPLDENLTVPYVVMELNDGESVSARLRRQDSLPWRDAVIMVAEVASALAAAHARGVVHRDVTPANVMLTGTGAKVVDFGISALIGQRDAAADGSLLGTPAYLAPERLSGSPVSPATDVYALGLLLYRTLTGRFPWPAGNTTEALRAHLFADPEPVPSLPGLPPEVADLCLRCLAKDPGQRPDAAEMAVTLGALVGLQPIIPPVPANEAAPRPSPHPVPRPSPRPGLRSAPRRAAGAPPRTAPRSAGGLFRGGLRELFSGGRLDDAVLAGRHRLQAGVATVVLAATLGLAWSSSREPVDVGTAQAAAAGAGPNAVAPHGSGCKVRYRVQRDTGTDFGAQVTVINTGAHVLSGWRLEFAFAGGQRLTDSPKRLSQRGRKLMLDARDGRDLRPGRSDTIVLSGSYSDSNPLPLTFRLNGHKCRAEVLGAVLTPETVDNGPAPPASTRKPASSTPSPRPPKKPAGDPAPAQTPAPRKDQPKSGFSVTI